MSASYDPPAIRGPVSAKIRVAACHVDFIFERKTALVDSRFLKKLKAIDEYFAALDKRPHLSIFPEGCAAEPLIECARVWASKWGITTIAGTRLSERNTVEAVIIGPHGEAICEKNHLSPYDMELGDPIPLQGSLGGLIKIGISDQRGEAFEARVVLVICYDFHYAEEWWTRLSPLDRPHLVAVPMFDLKPESARRKAYDLAKRQDLRSILVNKPTIGLRLEKDRAVPKGWWWAALASTSPRLFEFLSKAPLLRDRVCLRSSAHGPMNGSDRKHLERIKKLNAKSRELMIWEQRREAVVLGDYEIGVPANAGHEGADGVGFKYSGFSILPL